ncbi:UNVERIFIED_CONTAM: hypothetical protein GTU68_045232 [Idotea baltica]|nr:hypothetical protein [Idotea baltica]
MVGERNAADNTIQSYRRDLENAASQLRRKKRTLGSARIKDIEQYLESLSLEGLAATTIARHLSALKQFFRFLNTESLREDNPTLNIETPKTRKPLPKTLEGFEVDRMLSTALAKAQQAALVAWRLYAQLEVLYATGLRVSELVSLPKTAANAKGPFIMVRGKGNKERLVPLTPQAKTAMETYLQRLADYQKIMARSKTGHMTRQNFAVDLKQLAQRAGIKNTVSPHIMRHAFASHLLQNGADLRALQTLLGHSDISTTQIYTHIQTDHLRETLEALHPLANQSGQTKPDAEN